MPGIVLGPGDVGVNRQSPCPHGAYILVGGE